MRLSNTLNGNVSVIVPELAYYLKYFYILFILFPLVTDISMAQIDPASEADYMLPELYKNNKDGFIVIAHRGASAYYPENTMAAFRASVDMGAEMIELDVMLSKDGIPVVFHDLLLDKHTNGQGKISDFTLDELKKLDAGSWFDPEFSDQKIPTLEEVLEFAEGKIALNIEIKSEAVTDQIENGVEEKSLTLVKNYDMQNHVLFSSFNYLAVKHLKTLAPDIPVALLYNKKISGSKLPSELVNELRADAFNCHFREFDGKFRRNIISNEIPVFIYTVNREKKMKKLIDLGVTGIFSDKPDLLKQVAEDRL